MRKWFKVILGHHTSACWILVSPDQPGWQRQATVSANCLSTVLRNDFARREVVHREDLPEVPSPTTGVTRRMLEREGA